MADVSESGVIDNIDLRKASAGYIPFVVGDVLVAKITPCFENGKGAHVRGLPTRCGQGSTEFHVLRPRSATSDRYLYHLTRTSQFRLGGESLMSGSAGQRRVPTEFFDRYAVRMPPLEEQWRIAEILDTFDEAIEATKAVIAKCDGVLEGLLQSSGLGSPRAETPLYAISDFCSLSAGQTPPRSTYGYYGGGVPWVKSGEVAGAAILSTEETISAHAVRDLGLRMVSPNTPLVAMYGATAGEIGWLQISATTNQAVLAVDPDPKRANRRWLYWALRQSSQRILASIQGSGQPNLSKKIIGAARIALPDLRTQFAEVERIDAAQASIEAQSALASKLGHLRSALAADLLSGRIRTRGT